MPKAVNFSLETTPNEEDGNQIKYESLTKRREGWIMREMLEK